MLTISEKNLQKAGQLVAQTIADRIETSLEHKEFVVLALCGGRSIIPVLDGLLAIKSPKIPWSKVHLFFTDERVVDLDSNEANFHTIEVHLLDKLKTKPEVYPLDDVENGSLALEHVDGIDIGVFGAGEDGHIAALFPNHLALQSQEEGYIEISDAPKEPKKRITLSPHAISLIPHTILLFFDEAKKEAYAKLSNISAVPENAPGLLLNNPTIFTIFPL